MLRQFLCGLVAFVLFAGVGFTAEKKAKPVKGTFVSYKEGTLTLKLKAKKGEEAKSQDYKVADDVKVVTMVGEEKKEGLAKEAFATVKEGTAISLTRGEGDKITGVQVRAAKKKK